MSLFVISLLIFNLELSFSQSLFKSGDPVKVMQGSRAMCDKVAEHPNFDIRKLFGEPWRVYHTWHYKTESCFDFKFTRPSGAFVAEMRKVMSDYLEVQPQWSSAKLTMSLLMKRDRPEILLFADESTPGSFVGVPNIYKMKDFQAPARTLPLSRYQMKLLQNDRYLITIDCNMGLVTLSSRSDPLPYRSDTAKVASQFSFGENFPACTKEKHEDEQFDLRD